MIPISALEKYVYCPRQCALIHVDHRWRDNVHTARGQRGHRRADTLSHRRERNRVVVRAVPVFSDRLGLVGRADAIEVDDVGTIRPVEYKMGRDHGLAERVQLCAQALCLEEMLDREIGEGSIWYAGHRRRVDVLFDDALRERTMCVIEAVRELMAERTLPRAVNDGRCSECQLFDQCLPGLTDGSSVVDDYLRAVL